MKETLTQAFPCEICKISKNTFFHRTPPVAACIFHHFKVAPRVEKTEVFKKGSIFANQTYFTSSKMKNHYFLLWAKETAFFPYFYQWNSFLQRWAICLWSQLLILLEHLYIFEHKHKSNIKGRSNSWIKKQPLILGSAVQSGFASKASAISQVFYPLRVILRILVTCFRPVFLQNFSYF